jgi:hypothetical protein
MTASGNLGAQTVITFDIGLWFAVQGQCLWRIQWRSAHDLAVDQPVQQVQNMGLGRHALGQGKLNGGEHSLFIVVQHQGKDIDHFPVTAGFAQHVILQLSERRR